MENDKNSISFDVRKKSRNILFPIIGVLIVLFLVLIVFYSRIWDFSQHYSRPDPEEVVAKSIDKMLEARTGEFETKFNFILEFMNSAEIRTNLIFNGKYDKESSEKISMEGDFDISVSRILKPGHKEEYSASGKFIILENDLYYNFKKIEGWNELGNENINKWIKIENGLKSGEKAIQGKMQKRIIDNLKEKSYHVKEEMPDSVINGKKVYHYTVSLNNERLRLVLRDILQIISKEKKSFPEVYPLISETGMMVDKIFNSLKETDFDVWAGKKDNLFYRAEAKGSFIDRMMQGNASFNFQINYKNFGKPVSIEEPK